MAEAVTGRRSAARLLALCALLLAVLAMHCGPAAATGCHGAMPAAAMTASVHDTAAPPTATATGTLKATAGTSAAGDLCVATPARHAPAPQQLPQAAWLPPLAATGPNLTLVLQDADAGRYRGPPENGRDLLLQVGIARI